MVKQVTSRKTGSWKEFGYNFYRSPTGKRNGHRRRE